MKTRMKEIKEYRTAKGKIRYKTNIYLGRDEKGKPLQYRKSFKTYKEAEKACIKVLDQLENGTYWNLSQNITFKEMYEKWLKIYQLGTIKESTLATTERMIEKHVLPILGDMVLNKITVEQCQNAVFKWKNDAPKTFGKYARYTKKIFNEAKRLDYIEKSPMDKVIIPPVDCEPFKSSFYERDELKKYLEVARGYRKEAYAFFFLAGTTGLRCGELRALKWSDINLDQGYLYVNRTYTVGLNNKNYIDSPKTKSSARMVSLPFQTVELLKEWRVFQQKETKVFSLVADRLVFNGYKNMRPSYDVPISTTTLDRWNVEIAKKAGLDHIRVHDFRGTYASLMVSSHVDTNHLKEEMGHANIKTTMDRYAKTTNDLRKADTEKFESYLPFDAQSL